MKNYILLFFLIPFVNSCRFDEFKDCGDPIIRRVNLVDEIDTGYGYYFYIDNYDIRCFNSYFLSKRAEAFIDTLNSDKPVGSIYFGSSKKVFNEKENEIYYKDFKNHEGISFYYSKNKNSHNKPIIDFIVLYSNGKKYEIYIPQ